MKQLILVEGLPGTGKTTAAQKLFNRLSSKREAVSVFLREMKEYPVIFMKQQISRSMSMMPSVPGIQKWKKSFGQYPYELQIMSTCGWINALILLLIALESGTWVMSIINRSALGIIYPVHWKG